MAQQSSEPPDGVGAVESSAQDSLLSEVMGMASVFRTSRQRNRLLMMAAALIAVVGATAYAQVKLNAWNRPFYNALTRKDLPAFVEQIGVFAVLAGILLVLNVAQTWLNQRSKVVLREGLVNDLLNEWLSPRRAFRLSNSGAMGANPDQRLQADAQHLTDLTTELGIGLLQSTLLLALFIGVLWGLSRGMFLPFAGHKFAPPGYMVWCALLCAGAASYVSWRVGRPLIALDADHYAREAELRFGLVRVSEEIEGITLYGGEADEKRRLDAIFETVLDISRRIVGAVTRLTWVTAGYGWFTIVAPILVAAPGYLSSDMTFGELMMLVGAFNQVQTSLRWFVDNFSSIADWRATLLRVASFRKTILTMDKLGLTASRIAFDQGDGPSIRIDDLHVATPAGCVMLSEPHLELKPGEHVLIVGERGAGKTLLFRAIVGLWPWGSGHITRPARQSIAFIPTHAYIPPGVLRSSITYPRAADVANDDAIAKALAGVGLDRLKPMLGKAGRWDRELNDDEKQRIAFTRVILQSPRWVVIDNALDLVDPVSRRRIESVFTGTLVDVGVINIGKAQNDSGFFTRTLHLVRDPNGATFKPADAAAAPDRIEPAPETHAAH
jgi:vitamin B12/bleomycin/antimicrobial peptide transport system ATP-binding/permease protein